MSQADGARCIRTGAVLGCASDVLHTVFSFSPSGV